MQIFNIYLECEFLKYDKVTYKKWKNPFGKE